MKTRRTLGDIAAYIVLGAVGISMLVPFGWMIIGSLRAKTGFFHQTGSMLPTGPHWVNYFHAWTTVPYAAFFENSIIVAVAVTLGEIITCSFAAYAFARLTFKGRDALFLAILPR